MSETTLSKQIRLAVNRSGRARLLDNEVGAGYLSRRQGGLGRWVRFGLGEGSPDLIGILSGGSAICFAIEVKVAGGKLSAKQIAWWTAARKWGILGGVAMSVDEAMRLLEDAERCAAK